eukprot:CAMPEP_0201526116 /NCGR_PEP_ID=MMETSP0161_2-20130828/30659_1 /ASSEMBLY_ACC=CAM_ASM_000251 /TAXON_ID=180227 /ORGANISM="Neoparamoeba aestuarina, Strain SoJaBio B1-5/56/2" /LENGTH=103 /DNA_ID=CAMNT_0047926357 /DNA_START=1042 /DNA_END=1350 /DNA_ORIENTATION=-
MERWQGWGHDTSSIGDSDSTGCDSFEGWIETTLRVYNREVWFDTTPRVRRSFEVIVFMYMLMISFMLISPCVYLWGSRVREWYRGLREEEEEGEEEGEKKRVW